MGLLLPAVFHRCKKTRTGCHLSPDKSTAVGLEDRPVSGGTLVEKDRMLHLSVFKPVDLADEIPKALILMG